MLFPYSQTAGSLVVVVGRLVVVVDVVVVVVGVDVSLCAKTALEH